MNNPPGSFAPQVKGICRMCAGSCPNVDICGCPFTVPVCSGAPWSPPAFRIFWVKILHIKDMKRLENWPHSTPWSIMITSPISWRSLGDTNNLFFSPKKDSLAVSRLLSRGFMLTYAKDHICPWGVRASHQEACLQIKEPCFYRAFQGARTVHNKDFVFLNIFLDREETFPFSLPLASVICNGRSY